MQNHRQAFALTTTATLNNVIALWWKLEATVAWPLRFTKLLGCCWTAFFSSHSSHLRTCCRHSARLPAGTQTLSPLSSPTEKVLQSLADPTALGEAGIEPECSNRDVVNVQHSRPLCSSLNKMKSVESWSKLLPKKIILKPAGSCKCKGLDSNRNYFNVSTAPHNSTFCSEHWTASERASRYTFLASCFYVLCREKSRKADFSVLGSNRKVKQEGIMVRVMIILIVNSLKCGVASKFLCLEELIM